MHSDKGEPRTHAEGFQSSAAGHGLHRGRPAVLPIAYLWNDDYHYLRSDLGRAPNIEDSGSGWGY
jgi:hypothetical protein